MILPYWLRIRLKFYSKKIGVSLLNFSKRVIAIPHVENWNHNTAVVRDHLGVRLKLELNNYVDNTIFYSGYFEKPSSLFIEYFLKPGMNCVDVGANFGYYSLRMASLVKPSGHIYSFEPSVKFFKRLEENLALNKLSNITTINAGLSDEPQNLALTVGDQTASIHWVPNSSEPETGVEQISLITLDDYLEDKPITHLDFIKVDIDGHEFKFLKGAEKTINKFRPVLLLEVNHLNYIKAGVSVEEFFTYLVSKLGYRLFDEFKNEIKDYNAFLASACNFAYSSNIICSHRGFN